MTNEHHLTIPVSIGEIFDKITILELKLRHVRSEMARKNIEIEHEFLTKIVAGRGLADRGDLKDEVAALFQVNARLWDVEDDLRLCERRQDFGEDFVRLARSVYMLNDQRASIKKNINIRTGSAIVEEKLYAEYGQQQP